jgi:predicted DNA-binding transcriptional regulator YafY
LQAPDPQLDQLIRTAIDLRRLLRLRYQGRERIVEPHDYGEHNGSIKLLIYQIGGSSSGRIPSWRLLDVARITDAVMLDKAFKGGRPTPSGKHHHWDRLYMRVKPAA